MSISTPATNAVDKVIALLDQIEEVLVALRRTAEELREEQDHDVTGS